VDLLEFEAAAAAAAAAAVLLLPFVAHLGVGRRQMRLYELLVFEATVAAAAAAAAGIGGAWHVFTCGLCPICQSHMPAGCI